MLVQSGDKWGELCVRKGIRHIKAAAPISRGVVSAFDGDEQWTTPAQVSALYSTDFQVFVSDFTEAVFAMTCREKKFKLGTFSVAVS